MTVGVGDKVTVTNGGGFHNPKWQDGAPGAEGANAWSVQRTFTTAGTAAGSAGTLSIGPGATVRVSGACTISGGTVTGGGLLTVLAGSTFDVGAIEIKARSASSCSTGPPPRASCASTAASAAAPARSP